MIRKLSGRALALHRFGLTAKRPVSLATKCLLTRGIDIIATSEKNPYSSQVAHDTRAPCLGARGGIRNFSIFNISRDELAREKRLLQETELFMEAPLGDITIDGIKDMKRLIHEWCKQQKYSSSRKAEDLLERLISEGRDGQNLDAFVEARIYNVVIDSYGKCNHADGPRRAEAITGRMWDRWDSASLDDILRPAAPDRFTYNSLMHAWSKVRSDEALSKVEAIMDKLESNDFPVNADEFSFNTLMNAYANQRQQFGYAQKAEDILLHMSDLQREGVAGVRTDTTSFNIVLKAWQNSGGGIESAKRAEAILQLMMKLYNDGHQEVKPNTISFATVINAYSKPKRMTPEIADHLEGIADLLLNSESDIIQTPGLVSMVFGGIMEAFTKGKLADGGVRAKRFLDKMIQAKEDGKTPDNPTVKMYSEVMRASLASGENEGTLEMFNKMMDGEANIEPNTHIINGVLHHHCRKGDYQAAEDLFKSMTEIAEDKGFFTRPDNASFNMMANMYFHNNIPDAAQRALRLLEQSEEQYDAGYLQKLEIFLYSIIVNILLKRRNLDMSRKTYDVLMKAIERFDAGDLKQQPDTIVFNMVLTSLTRQHTTEAAERALSLIQIMEDRVAEGYKSTPPDTISYTHCLMTLARGMNRNSSENIVNVFRKVLSLYRSKDEYVELDTTIYQTVLFGLAHPIYGDRNEAHKVLETMKKQDGMNPTPACLDSVVKAHCSSKDRRENEMPAFDAKRYILDLVDQFENGELNALPTLSGFHSVLHSFKYSKHWKAFDECLELYDVMKKLSDQGMKGLTPTKETVNLMLNAAASGKQDKSTEKVDKFMESLASDDLDTKAYNTYMIILAKSRTDNLIRTRKVLDDLVEKGLADTSSYGIMINACAHDNCGQGKRALELALKTYRELMDSPLSPNEATYIAMMKACNSHSDDKREGEERLQSIFNDACEQGLVSQKVLKEVRYGFPMDRRKEVIGFTLIEGDMKKEWTRNIKHQPRKQD